MLALTKAQVPSARSSSEKQLSFKRLTTSKFLHESSGAERKAASQLHASPHQSKNACIAQVMVHCGFVAYWELFSSLYNSKMNVQTLHVPQMLKMDPPQECDSPDGNILMLFITAI